MAVPPEKIEMQSLNGLAENRPRSMASPIASTRPDDKDKGTNAEFQSKADGDVPEEEKEDPTTTASKVRQVHLTLHSALNESALRHSQDGMVQRPGLRRRINCI